MTRMLNWIAFVLGAAAVLWMGAIFVGVDALALTVTAVIGLAYVIGVVELWHFRSATESLSKALDSTGESVDSLESWLSRLEASLRNSVRLRVEGERTPLPAPVMTPYLVGLLVMLGLLGTFVGMVDTLQGAVAALQGTSELEAIRAGLAAPIEGLGLAFGTSVAGVSASAMLGLMSTLCRRERLLQSRRLDTQLTGALRGFSLVHQRQETYDAIRSQSQALPQVADKLMSLADSLDSMKTALNDQLLANQQSFHESVTSSFEQLAQSVSDSLQHGVEQQSQQMLEAGEQIANSGRLAGESLRPVLEQAMSDLRVELKGSVDQSHEQLNRVAQEQLQSQSSAVAKTTETVEQVLRDSLAAQDESHQAVLSRMEESLQGCGDELTQRSRSLIEQLQQVSDRWLQQQQQGDQLRLEQLSEAFGQAQQRASEDLAKTTATIHQQLSQAASMQTQSLQTVTGEFEQQLGRFAEQWQQHTLSANQQQQQLLADLRSCTTEMSAASSRVSSELLDRIGTLVQSSEQLVQARMDTERRWLEDHGQRVGDITEVLGRELKTLREDEQRRGDAALERLSALEGRVAEHLVSLGSELQGPMSELIATASEAPQAAARVIAQLREEISNNIERDNKLLQERRDIFEQLERLSASLQSSSEGQQEAVTRLLETSESMLGEAGGRFAERVDAESEKLASVASDVNDQFAGSAVELASLGEAFGVAVEQFNQSNQILAESFASIETALQQSGARSDEQMGYYVAQARDIIDHSVLSQKQMLEELRQFGRQDELNLTAAAEA
ncbi:hypothetical protein HBA55_25480 [Pseudomaricurvus alkylphenolicus]|uniref:hypothetical protein n=1 Tax=Pseudomaricurvus alkylphenolicus TaxID=1306991 RepID=UPI0014211074|nr:hypothetical protein [Pseudomaricurvus alkylphenolicus]NIB42985.1 hypothetical protein [Pseudomaricurvus alkylphenolicus]